VVVVDVVVVVVDVEVVVSGSVVVVTTVGGLGVLASDVDAQAGNTNMAAKPRTVGTETRISPDTLATVGSARGSLDTVIRERFGHGSVTNVEQTTGPTR